jgi:KaiC/GvpD/RAD55 family RecA-like ATPase
MRMVEMELTKELKDNQVILLLVEGSEYNDFSLKVARELFGKKVCYITLNKTCPAIIETFSKSKIKLDNVRFIDAISKTITGKVKDTDSCVYISSPGALTELSMAITEFIKKGYDYIIFDSLTNLLIYQGKGPVAKFVANLITKIKASKTKAVFYALKVDQHQELIQEASMFVDKVIDTSK